MTYHLSLHPNYLNLLTIQSASDKLLLQQTSITYKKTLTHYLNNLLSFNLLKFIYMSFHRKFTSKYVINGHAINESSSYKDLGIIFTNTVNITKWFLPRHTNPLVSYAGFKTPTALKSGNLFISHWFEPNYYTVLLSESLIYYRTLSYLRELSGEQLNLFYLTTLQTTGQD